MSRRRTGYGTTDIAYRRAVLRGVEGFDERFAHSRRDASDLGLRVIASGAAITSGRRRLSRAKHAGAWHRSLVAQRAAIDDARMQRLHGRDWWSRAGVPRGRRAMHGVAVFAACGTAAAGALRHRKVAVGCSALWAGATAELARSRLQPGPRHPATILGVLVTSATAPFVGTAAWLYGRWFPLPDRPAVGVWRERRGSRSLLEAAR